MSSTLTDSPATGIAPPVRPSVWRVGWATFVGYVITLVLGFPIASGMSYLGIDVWDGTGRGLFLRYDVWSWLAEACAGLLATGLTAFVVRDSLHQRTGWEVPYWFTFGTLLLTGYVPLLALTPLYGATAPVSLVAATLILRSRAEPAGAEPRKWLGGVPLAHRRRVAIGLAVGAPLMLAYVLGYGATHPLRPGVVTAAKIWSSHPGKLHRYELYLENAGPFEVSDVSVVGVDGSPALQLERVGRAARSWTPPAPRALRPLRDYSPGSGYSDSDAITLELRQGRLCPPGLAKLDAVRIRYTLLDGRREQRIPLDHPPQVRCP